MKKMNRFFGVITLAALLAVGSASCKKNNTTNSSFTFALPAVEGFSADEGKAYIDIADNSRMKWYDGDEMMIYSVDATNTTPSMGVFTADAGVTGALWAHFNGPSLEAGSYGYFAFYPASKAGSVAADNYATFIVGDRQTYTHDLNFEGTSMAGRAIMDPRGVVAASTCAMLNGSVNTTLNHIFGFANIKVKATSGTKKVTSVKIEDKKLHLTGDMTIQIPAITDARLSALQTLGTKYAAGTIEEATYMIQLNGILHEMGYSSKPNGNVVTLDCSDYEGGAVPITDKNKFFIVPLRPGALLGDFTITLTYDNGQSQEFNFNDKQYIIRPGWFSNIQIML